jgi:hypothetical protein
MLRTPPLGHSLQKRKVVQWDMGALLGRGRSADESMSPQFGIRASFFIFASTSGLFR